MHFIYPAKLLHLVRIKLYKNDMDVFIWHQRSKYDTYKILATVS